MMGGDLSVCIGVVANVSITVSLKSLRSLHSFAILGSILSVGDSRKEKRYGACVFEIPGCHC
jgi:hypothetical protein